MGEVKYAAAMYLLGATAGFCAGQLIRIYLDERRMFARMTAEAEEFANG